MGTLPSTELALDTSYQEIFSMVELRTLPLVNDLIGRNSDMDTRSHFNPKDVGSTHVWTILLS